MYKTYLTINVKSYPCNLSIRLHNEKYKQKLPVFLSIFMNFQYKNIHINRIILINYHRYTHMTNNLF